MTMSDTEGAVVMDEASQQAFYVRINQLYQMYEDWTGQTEEDVDEATPARAQVAETKQSNGQKCITPVEALTTIVMFSARLAVDFEMDRNDFLDSIATLYDNELAEEEADGEGDEDARGASAEPS